MGFKSLFPSFNRDEVTPSETDVNPDVESRIGRTLARLQAFSNVLSVFKFLRSDYNGRLHINNGPTDFGNYRFGSYAVLATTTVICPANPDRQMVWIKNIGPSTPTLGLQIGSDVVWQDVLAVGDFLQLTGFVDVITITSGVASGVVNFWEI